METIDLANLIKSRRSIRSWQNKEVSKVLLLRAIELATYAPNAGNQQNWRFYVIINKDTINSIADKVEASANYIASLPEASILGEHGKGGLQRASFFRNAPSIIAVATKQYRSPIDQVLATKEKTDFRGAQIREWRKKANSGIQSVASAIAYLLLILHEMGLGAVWMTGPIMAKGEIEKILQVPDHMDLIAFIPVGYPSENPPLKERKPVMEICEILY